uniref:Uncharacterized protein n=1 Tax=Romanomermis culicivorax TaxID=13658 RepID=A0A915IHZ4_ROMCU
SAGADKEKIQLLKNAQHPDFTIKDDSVSSKLAYETFVRKIRLKYIETNKRKFDYKRPFAGQLRLKYGSQHYVTGGGRPRPLSTGELLICMQHKVQPNGSFILALFCGTERNRSPSAGNVQPKNPLSIGEKMTDSNPQPNGTKISVSFRNVVSIYFRSVPPKK